MNTIYQYKLPRDLQQDVEFPRGARILSAQSLGVHVWIWALVDTEETARDYRRIIILKTGEEIPFHTDLLEYIGTVQFEDGATVLHVFEMPSETKHNWPTKIAP